MIFIFGTNKDKRTSIVNMNMNMDNYMYHPESERRQRMTIKKEKANQKYINKRTGNGHGRLGKVARGVKQL